MIFCYTDPKTNKPCEAAIEATEVPRPGDLVLNPRWGMLRVEHIRWVPNDLDHLKPHVYLVHP